MTAIQDILSNAPTPNTDVTTINRDISLETGADTNLAEDAFGISFEGLLALQLKALEYQDPLEPDDTSDLSKQLSDFSQVSLQESMSKDIAELVTLQADNSSAISALSASQEALVEGIANSNTSLSDIAIKQGDLLNQQTGGTVSGRQEVAIGLIGKEYLVPAQQITFAGEDVSFNYSAPEIMRSVDIVITDKNGKEVFRDKASTAGGENSFTWDGSDSDGDFLTSGEYTVTIEAVNASREEVQLLPYNYKLVTAVESIEADTFLVFEDGSSIEFTDSFSARNPQPTTTS